MVLPPVDFDFCFLMKLPMNRFIFPIALFFSIASSVALAQRTDTRPVAGIADHPVQDFLLTHARVVVEPGVVLENASVWIEDGKIVQVGSDIQPRSGLRSIDMSGKTLYPGLIDLGLEADLPEFASNRGTPHWNPEITPQRSVAQTLENLPNIASLRRSGITTALLAPKDGILKGTSALVMTADAPLGAMPASSNRARPLRPSGPRPGRAAAAPPPRP